MEKIYEIVKIKQVIREVEEPSLQTKICSPDDAGKIAHYFIGDDDREVFLVICLNTKNQVIAVHRCHVGALNYSIVHTREVFKSCILNNANSFIVAHNHPSLDVQQSREDIEVTKRLKEAGEILGIPLLDHIIVNSKGEYTSLKEKGYI
jgi:DNA repair protein RadC